MGYVFKFGLQNEELLQDPAVAAEFEQLIASLQRQLITQLGDIANPPRMRVFLNASQSIPDSTETFLQFVPARTNNVEEYDSVSMYEQSDLSVVISTPGLYILAAQVVWSGASVLGSRTCTFAQVNGIIEMVSRFPGDHIYHPHMVPIQVTPEQVATAPIKFGVRVFQSSGGALSATSNSWFAAYRVAKL